jgi:L-amino acid N-acyltransferase YncA
MVQTEPATPIVIDELQPDDWPQVRAIYGEGMATGNATFEQELPAWTAWEHGHLPVCRIVARRDGVVLGWAALSPVSSRCVYGGVAEVSVYVGEDYRGQGLGRRLLEALVARSEAAGLWTLQAGIFPENRASVAVHERCGFRVVGCRERLGQMHGTWRDVLLLERRSTVAGV